MITVDSTTLGWYDDCPMKFKLRTIDYIVPMEKSMAFSYGHCTHEAMAMWYTTGDLEKMLLAFKKDFKENKKDKVRTLKVGLRTLIEYADKYQKEPFKVIMIEKPYAMQLTDNIIISGRMDGIIEFEGLSLVLEHKTTTRMGFSYFQQFTPNTQISIYALLCKELIGHCEGVYLNAIAVSTKDEASRQKEALSNKKKAVRSSNYYREIINRTPKQLKFAKENIIKTVRAMQWAKKENSFYRNEKNCAMMGSCPYRDLCNSFYDERVIRLKYKRKKWNPLVGKEEDI